MRECAIGFIAEIIERHFGCNDDELPDDLVINSEYLGARQWGAIAIGTTIRSLAIIGRKRQTASFVSTSPGEYAFLQSVRIAERKHDR